MPEAAAAPACSQAPAAASWLASRGARLCCERANLCLTCLSIMSTPRPIPQATMHPNQIETGPSVLNDGLLAMISNDSPTDLPKSWGMDGGWQAVRAPHRLCETARDATNRARTRYSACHFSLHTTLLRDLNASSASAPALRSRPSSFSPPAAVAHVAPQMECHQARSFPTATASAAHQRRCPAVRSQAHFLQASPPFHPACAARRRPAMGRCRRATGCHRRPTPVASLRAVYQLASRIFHRHE